MWELKHIADSKCDLVQYTFQQDHLPPRLERLKLSRVRLKGECEPMVVERERLSSEVSSRYLCNLHPTPVALSLRTSLEGISYDVNIHLFDDKEVGALKRLAEDQCLRMLADYESKIVKLNGTQYEPVFRKYKRELEAAIDADFIGVEFRENGYVRPFSWQRGWKNTAKSREVEATAPLTAQELTALKPVILTASGLLPELAPPLRDRAYYQTLLRRWCNS